MAGAGYKLFNTGDVLTAAQVNTYLNEQTVMVFASSTARTTALSGVLAEGMMSYLQDTNAVEVYNGTSWVNVGNAGDITEVQAGVGISIASGTGPIPVITNSSTDLITTAGDLLYGTAADTVARLGIGTAGQVLKVNSGATAPEWGAAGGGGMTLISTTALSGSSVSLTSIPGTYRSLYFYISGVTITSAANYNLIFEPNGTASTGRWGAVIRSGTTTATDGASTQLRGSIYETIDGASANNVWILNIYEYASSTKYKAIDLCGGYKGASTDNAGIAGGWWPDNTAITSFTISTSTSTFNAGSISLYGVQ